MTGPGVLRARRRGPAAIPDRDDELAFPAGYPAGGEVEAAGSGDADAAWEQALEWRRVLDQAGGLDRRFDDDDLPF